MSMPTAPVHENARPVFPQNQVRMSGQSLVIQTISEPSRPQPPPHDHLWLRILRVDSSHICVPLLWSELIHKYLFALKSPIKHIANKAACGCKKPRLPRCNADGNKKNQQRENNKCCSKHAILMFLKFPLLSNKHS